jgi:hypothetical protein
LYVLILKLNPIHLLFALLSLLPPVPYMHPQLLILCFDFYVFHPKVHIVLWETERETKSPRPFCRKQEFCYASSLREIISQSPKPQSVWGEGFYPSGGLCNQGIFAAYGSVTGKQVGYRICHSNSLIECGYSYRKPCSVAGGVQYCRASRKLLADSE